MYWLPDVKVFPGRDTSPHFSPDSSVVPLLCPRASYASRGSTRPCMRTRANGLPPTLLDALALHC